MFEAHAMMYFECRNCSGSVPSFTPSTDFNPASPAAEQIDRSSCDAPSRWKNRRSMEEPLRTARVPPYEYGRIASLPNSLVMSLKREAISDSASCHEIRAKSSAFLLPPPFGATRRIG